MASHVTCIDADLGLNFRVSELLWVQICGKSLSVEIKMSTELFGVSEMLIVPWSGALTSGRLVQRRHRFLLDVILDDGRSVVAHCVNPGRMEGLIKPGSKVWLSSAPGEKRNLHWVWELVKINGTMICANSWTANKLVKKLLSSRAISGHKQYKSINEEIKLGLKARIDFEVLKKEGSHFIEVKSVQQVYGAGVSYFPDSQVLRSQQHLKALLGAIEDGKKATLLAVVQRKDAKIFRPSDLHDPIFSQTLRRACKKGLKVRAILLEPTVKGFRYIGDLPVDLKEYEINEIERWKEEMKPFSGWARTKADPNSSWRKREIAVVTNK